MFDLGKLALLGSSNLEYLAMGFRDEAELLGVSLDVHVPEFGQVSQQLLLPDGSSELKQFNPDVSLIVERGEDILGPLAVDPLGFSSSDFEAELNNSVDRYIQSLDIAIQNLTKSVFVLLPSYTTRSPLCAADKSSNQSVSGALNRVNASIQDYVRDAGERVEILDSDSWIQEFGKQRAHPAKYWSLGRVPYSIGYSKYLAKKVIGRLLASSGATTRLMILDLDNTLWGGVIGEDGIEGIQLGGGYPGNAYRDFQIALKALSRRGIALAVASKNDHDVAMSAIENHPEMILRPDDFVTTQISWQPKEVTIPKIIEEVSIGASSCCFIDDNPVERQKARIGVPSLIIPEFPDDPADLADWLLGMPWVECSAITDSDLKRTSQYRVRAKLAEKKKQFTNLDDFLADLSMKLDFAELHDNNAARITQLLAKTNQFNTTTVRYTLPDLKSLVEQGRLVFGIGLSDRYSPRELMGVVVLDPNHEPTTLHVNSFLLSCHILGRNVETAVLAWITQKALELGKTDVTASVVETPKNTPVRDVFSKHGFKETKPKFFTSNVGDGVCVPDYISVVGLSESDRV